MRGILLSVMLSIAGVSSAFAQQVQSSGGITANTEDVKVIREIVASVQRGWDTLDPRPVAADYAADAEYTNAFGAKIKGKAEIEKFFVKLFASPRVKDRRTVWNEPVIRFLRSDVAIVTQTYETVGHISPTEQLLSKRLTHSIRVLSKENGRWSTVTHLVMDERDREPTRPAKEGK